jgi:hypothetical protein
MGILDESQCQEYWHDSIRELEYLFGVSIKKKNSKIQSGKDGSDFRLGRRFIGKYSFIFIDS